MPNRLGKDSHFLLSLPHEGQTRLLGGQLAISATIGNWIWQPSFGEVRSCGFKGNPGVPMYKFNLMAAGKINWVHSSVITCSLNFIHLRISSLSSGLISDVQRIFRGRWKIGDQKIISGPRRRLLPVRFFFKSSPEQWAPIFTKLPTLIYFQQESKSLYLLSRESKSHMVIQPTAQRKGHTLSCTKSFQTLLSASYASNHGAKYPRESVGS